MKKFIVKTKLMELKVGDLDHLKHSKQKIFEKSFEKDIDTIQYDLQKDFGLKAWDSIFVSISPEYGWDVLFGIHSLVKDGYIKLNKDVHIKYNMWYKKKV